MTGDTLSDRLAKRGKYDTLGDYQQLKVASEMERSATRELFEHYKRQHGEAAAIEMLKAKGYDPAVI
jgi:hypothetical protein